MKLKLYLIITIMLFLPGSLFSQTLSQLWKQAVEAENKDLPKTELEILERIQAKAAQEKAYGHLLKAALKHAQVQANVAPDSLKNSVKRMEQQAGLAGDEALSSVYFTALSRIYATHTAISSAADSLSSAYKKQALQHAEALARVKDSSYQPLVVAGRDSEIYGHDLLSVVGCELEAYEELHAFYAKTGQKRAACWTALLLLERQKPSPYNAERGRKYLEQLDSLCRVYDNLSEAGQVAIARYEYMQQMPAVTAREKHDYLTTALQKWGGWKRANVLRNYQRALVNPQFSFSIPDRVARRQQPQTVQLRDLRHLKSLTMRVYRTRLGGQTHLNPADNRDYQRIKSGMTELTQCRRTIAFAPHADYETFEDSLQLSALDAGVYLIELSTEPQTHVSRQLYYVSQVRVLQEQLPEKTVRYAVVDATTGQPLRDAQLQISVRNNYQEEPQTLTLHCDSMGEARYKYRQQAPETVYATTATDRFCPPSDGSGRFIFYENRSNIEQITVFTDRSIYRPGQTLHAAAIVYRTKNGIETTVVPRKQLTIQLRDANQKVVSEQQVQTDDYGKCSASFSIPTGQLTGNYSLRVGNTQHYFRVEEYKRPTFYVEFPEYTAKYQAGDTVRAKAKAQSYAGVPVQEARVKYKVTRRVAYWWLSYSSYWQRGIGQTFTQNQMVGEGETLTGDDGTFEVDMPMRLPDDAGELPMFYHFIVEADVTDQAGEAHTATFSLPLGTKPTTLTCDLPAKLRIDQQKTVTFNRRNAAGKEIEGMVEYRIDGKEWLQTAANSAIDMDTWALHSGEHTLEARCEHDTIATTFVVFSLTDVAPCVKTHDWFYVSDSEFSKNAPVTVQVGASDSDLHIVYSIIAGDKVIENGTLKESNSLYNRQLSYNETYGDGLLLTFAWVKNGQTYTHQATIRRPMPDKKLSVKWTTFRDRLTPGQQEEWRLSIVNPDGTPADAQLLAVLYDKSLDQIRRHQWAFTPTLSVQLPNTHWRYSQWGSLSDQQSQNYKSLTVNELQFSHFDETVFPTSHFYQHRIYRTTMLQKNMVAMAAPMSYAKEQMTMDSADGGVKMKNATVGAKEEKALNDNGTLTETEQETDGGDVQMRENLQETAFFYPALMADSTGQVILKFTLPESLTTWRFMGLAHTKDVCSGMIEAETVAKKDVMIQPNVPRFVRVGDETQLTARIFNTSEQQVKGIARMELIDPESGKTLLRQQQNVVIEAGKTIPVTFNVAPDGRQSLLICKVMVSGKAFSDGEQHYLAVLPEGEMVTKTIPFTQRNAGTLTLDMAALFPKTGITNSKLTVEYTNNPAWLMVQSLPVVGQPRDNSAIDFAASYYSNAIGTMLMQQNLKAKTVFEQWKNETQTEQTLQSNLQKNQELKDIVLAETPWVGAADRESEQKQRLADFFDANQMSNRQASTLQKLEQLQLKDGSFSWYPGMRGSTYITVTVVEMLARLTAMTGQDSEYKSMKSRAVAYVADEMVKLVDEMRKEEKKGLVQHFPTFTALQWLYICAIDAPSLTQKQQLANDYLTTLLKKDIRKQTIYEKALTAIILNRHGEPAKAREYVQSLKEYTVYTDEMGRYYDAPKAAYSWCDYRIPTEVAAIEAIQKVTPDDRQTIEEMQRWLLQEKRTQAWDTPINSVNAIYAFLNGQTEWLTSQEETVLMIDGQRLELPKATAGLGYVKTAVAGGKGKRFTAKKASKGVSWGALYAQYVQKSSEIEASGSGITVKRDIVSDGALKVGDRVKVRITIEASRDMDFVQVVDRRAACMEPVRQLSGYANGAYCSPKDCSTNYYFDQLRKGKHVIETEYFVDRAGRYETGICTVSCAYSPEYRATDHSKTLIVK